MDADREGGVGEWNGGMQMMKADVLTRIEMIGQLNERLSQAIVSGDWEDMLKLEQMFLAMAVMTRKEIIEHGTANSDTFISHSAKNKRGEASPRGVHTRAVVATRRDVQPTATVRNRKADSNAPDDSVQR